MSDPCIHRFNIVQTIHRHQDHDILTTCSKVIIKNINFTYLMACRWCCSQIWYGPSDHGSEKAYQFSFQIIKKCPRYSLWTNYGSSLLWLKACISQPFQWRRAHHSLLPAKVKTKHMWRPQITHTHSCGTVVTADLRCFISGGCKCSGVLDWFVLAIKCCNHCIWSATEVRFEKRKENRNLILKNGWISVLMPVHTKDDNYKDNI